MSDRLAVLVDGRVDQVGEPQQVYAEPATAYVAGFLGTANLLDVDVRSVRDGVAYCLLGELDLAVRAGNGATSGPAQVVVRPERVHLGPAGDEAVPAGNRFRGTVAELVFQGPTTQAVLAVGDTTLVTLVPNAAETSPSWLTRGASVEVVISVDGARLLAGPPPIRSEPQ
jgi:spermidine/putrescine transport system ATP-binding protein